MSGLGADLDHFFRRHRCKGLTVWPTPEGTWQANIQNPDQSWRIMIGDTPSEAIQRCLYEFGSDREAVEEKPRKRRNDDLI